MGRATLVAVIFLFLLEVFPSLSQADPPFPELSNQFITEVEANILNKNRTVQVTEYYDYPGNQGRLEVFSNGSRHIAIFNYNEQLLYQVRDVDARVCTVRRFNRNSAFGLFTAILPNGTAHIQSVADFFRFGKKYYDSYNGTATVRGILCDVYTSQLVNNTFNFSMKWYFAARSDWTMPLGGSSPSSAVPVRLDLEGYNQNFNRTEGGQRVPTPGSHYFHHIYEFVNFRVGTADEGDHLFDPPHGIPCQGQPVVKTLPQLPDQFTASFQTAIPNYQLSYWSLMGYDSTKESVSYIFNFVTPQNDTSNGFNLSGIHHVVHNFAEGTEYNMTLDSCAINLVNASKTADVVNNQNKLFLAPPNKLFGFEVSRNFTYEGEREVDGMMTDLWMVTRTDVPIGLNRTADQPTLWEYYFSKPKWHYISLAPAEEHQVLVLVEGHSLLPGKFDTDKMIIRVNNFQIGAPRSFFFDNTRCFNSSSSKTVHFILPTDYYAFSNNISASFSLSSSLASVMNISQSRLHVHVDQAVNNQVAVTVRVHDLPTVGNPDLLKRLTPLSTALKKLQTAINTGTLSVNNGMNGFVKPKIGSYSTTGLSTSSSTSSSGYSAGALAGVSVGMLIVGIMVGIIGLCVVQRRKST